MKNRPNKLIYSSFSRLSQPFISAVVLCIRVYVTQMGNVTKLQLGIKSSESSKHEMNRKLIKME